MKKSFDILTLSTRKWNSYHEEGCYNLNLIFRVWDISEQSYTKSQFLYECQEWQQTEIVTDTVLAENYALGLSVINKNTGKNILEESKDYDNTPIPIDFVNTNGIEREDVYTKGYQHNWSNMLSYDEKFNVFRFHEFFEINPATEGIISYIRELKELKNPDEYHAGQLLRAIKSLELWWD